MNPRSWVGLKLKQLVMKSWHFKKQNSNAVPSYIKSLVNIMLKPSVLDNYISWYQWGLYSYLFAQFIQHVNWGAHLRISKAPVTWYVSLNISDQHNEPLQTGYPTTIPCSLYITIEISPNFNFIGLYTSKYNLQLKIWIHLFK